MVHQLVFTGGDINIATSGKKYLQGGNPVLDGTNTTSQNILVGMNSAPNSTGVRNCTLGYNIPALSGTDNIAIGYQTSCGTANGAIAIGIWRCK